MEAKQMSRSKHKKYDNPEIVKAKRSAYQPNGPKLTGQSSHEHVQDYQATNRTHRARARVNGPAVGGGQNQPALTGKPGERQRAKLREKP